MEIFDHADDFAQRKMGTSVSAELPADWIRQAQDFLSGFVDKIGSACVGGEIAGKISALDNFQTEKVNKVVVTEHEMHTDFRRTWFL